MSPKFLNKSKDQALLKLNRRVYSKRHYDKKRSNRHFDSNLNTIQTNNFEVTDMPQPTTSYSNAFQNEFYGSNDNSPTFHPNSSSSVMPNVIINAENDCNDYLLSESSSESELNASSEYENPFEIDDTSDESQEECLFEGSNTTINEFLVTILALKFKHNLADNATNDFLKLINQILPSNNRCPKNLNKFERQQLDKHIVDYYLICNNEKCNKLSNKEPFNSYTNTEKKCNSCAAMMKPFITFDIESQLRCILKPKNKLEQIKKNYINNLNKQPNFEIINDAFDGQIYKSYFNDCSNNNDLIISIILSSDGAPISKSQNISMWPLMGTILELNQSSREKFENIIFLGKILFKMFIKFSDRIL